MMDAESMNEATDVWPLLSLHAFNQWSYCAHRFWWMYACGEMARNAHVYQGLRHHRRVDRGGDRRQGGEKGVRQGALASQRFSISVRHRRLGLHGVLDLLERSESGGWCPVETKAGRAPGHDGVWPNDALQVAAQALCIEDTFGTDVPHAWVYYAGSRRRVVVEVDGALRSKVERACEAMRDILGAVQETRAHYSGRCEGCSLIDICLPKAQAHIARLKGKEL